MNGTKKALAVLLVIAAVVAVVSFFRSGITIAQVIVYARDLRHVWWAPLAYFVAYAVCNVLFIPTQLLSIAAAVIWGWAMGGTIELFAATLGAMFPYWITRWLRRPGMSPLRNLLRREGFTLLLVLRLVPVVPYTALNYAAALSPITPAQYALATFLGIIPSTYIFAFFVDSIVTGVMQPRDVVWRILLAGALLATLVIVTRRAALRLPQRDGETPRHAERSPDDVDHAGD